MTHTNNTPAQQILNLMDAKINEMVENIVSNAKKLHAERNQEYNPSAYDVELIRLSLVIDLLKSVEKYTLSTDVVLELTECMSPKGFTIYATIEREGQQYKYSTDAIIAGGYNIQCLHYRYITNTNLPRINASFDMVNEMKAKVKKMNAEQRILNEIQYKKNAIARYEKELAIIESKSQDEVINSDCFNTRKYEDLWEGHHYGTKEEYLYEQSKRIQMTINMHKGRIQGTKSYIKGLHKDIQKLETKLSNLK